MRRAQLINTRQERRKKMFSVTVESLHEEWRTFKDEVELSITTNGSQWQSVSLSEHEARQVVIALADHFKWEMELS